MAELLALSDHLVALEPIGPGHVQELETAAADGNLGELWFTSVPATGQTAAYVDDACRGRDEARYLPFAVRDVRRGLIVGSTRFYDLAPEVPRVAIGHTWYAAEAQRSHINSACKRLLLTHAFEDLGCVVVELHTDFYNQPSRRAIERLGARQDGILRAHQRRGDGTLRDTVCFSILASEWPDVRRTLDLRIARSLARLT
ncbi:GNAT family N-acetyltransferase [soil metagenome]